MTRNLQGLRLALLRECRHARLYRQVKDLSLIFSRYCLVAISPELGVPFFDFNCAWRLERRSHSLQLLLDGRFGDGAVIALAQVVQN